MSPPTPRHVFHHLPKCGGNSLKIAMASWFRLVEDYRVRNRVPALEESPEGFAARPLNLSELTGDDLLLGHFDTDGARLWERYSEVYRPPFRLITFLRDPLDRAVSHYHFGAATGRLPLLGASLEAHLEATENAMARLLAPDPDEAEDRLAHYWFVGRLETAGRDLVRLAGLLGRPVPALPHVNATPRGPTVPSPALVARFKARNAIDYRLWERAGAPW